jgi:hypothetical protein
MVIDQLTDTVIDKSELFRLRDLGKYYLQQNLIVQALQTYLALMEKYPDDVSTLVIIGDSYLMAGDANAAKLIYQMAGDLQPDRTDLRQRVLLAEKSIKPDTSIAGGFPPLHPQAISRLAERLSGHSLSIDDDQVRQAAMLLEKTVHSDSPATSVSEHLDEIDALLPAILELNIRQARSQGKSELAANLIEIQQNLIKNQTVDGTVENHTTGIDSQALAVSKTKRIILLGEPSDLSPLRQSIIQIALEQSGVYVNTRWEDIPLPWEGFDMVVAHNPHTNPIVMKALAGWAGAGNPVLVDMDTDFRIIHPGSPDKNSPGTESAVDRRIFTAALQLADLITLPSTTLAMAFSNEGYQAYALPDGWSSKNSLWSKQVTPSAKLNLGIYVEPGCMEDVASIRRVVIRILREFPQTRLVVSGDPEAYSLFNTIPDTRRVYLPPTEPEDYPYLLAQADIHLFPSDDDNASKFVSDRKYMEIGARKAVWIGSPVPASEEWSSGGLIARSTDDWYTHLKTLIMDADLRQKLAQEGYAKAFTREARNMAPLWESLIQKTLNTRIPKPFLRGGR